MTGGELALACGYAGALRRRAARGECLRLAELRWLVAHEHRERQAARPATQPKEPHR